MQTQMACLVNNEGQYLAHSNPAMQSRHCLGETQDPLELDMLTAMKEKKPYASPSCRGGYIPEHVIGYYKLQFRMPGYPGCRTPGKTDPRCPFCWFRTDYFLHLCLTRHPYLYPAGGEAGGHGHPRHGSQGRVGGPVRVRRAVGSGQP